MTIVSKHTFGGSDEMFFGVFLAVADGDHTKSYNDDSDYNGCHYHRH